MTEPIYLDNHSTTRVDPRVVEVMLPWMLEKYGNAGSTNHCFGWQAKEAVDQARQVLARQIGAKATELIFTSGATESNNLAIRGGVLRRQSRGRHLISVETEHRAVLDPLDRLARQDCDVTLLPVHGAAHEMCGQLDLQALRAAIRSDTALVSVMLANNEIGVLQPIADIAKICHEHDVLFHCDATQAVGKIPVDVHQLGVDLMSFSAHKMYGPKGIGALYVRRRSPQIRLVPLIEGGGQEKGMRSGTLPVQLIVGFALALQLAVDEMPTEIPRQADLRQRLYDGLMQIDGCHFNGPTWPPLAEITIDRPTNRLPNNLNLRFDGVEGESLMLSAGQIAVSSGSACTSASPEPSHVLRALGLSDDQVRSSLRFGLGRFTTKVEIDVAVLAVTDAVQRLRQLA